jgi:hypothetical protein
METSDVFAPRFAVNLQNTIINVLECEPSDKVKHLYFLSETKCEARWLFLFKKIHNSNQITA